MLETSPPSILRFDTDLHAEARTVLSSSQEPQNPFEVAIALEISGYTDERAQQLGSPDVFDLARRVFAVLDLYGGTAPPTTDGSTSGFAAKPSRISPTLLARSLLYSTPWLLAIAALLISRVSFWSTITTIQFSSTITLALFMALVLTGGFIQAFARRGTFYALQGNYPLLRWVTAWSLGSAAATVAIVYLALYAVLEWWLHAYTPNSVTVFVLFGVSISAMLLALAPLYNARAFGLVAAVVGVGALFLVVAGLHITHGQYIDPYAATRVQLIALWIVTVLATVADLVVLRRTVAATGETVTGKVRTPRASSVLRSVAGYATYGSAFFALIVMDQLIAGGLWHGGFVYDGYYEIAVGVGLLVLIPTLTYVAAVSEIFPTVVQRALADNSVAHIDRLRRQLSGFYRRHLAVLCVVGAVSAGVLFAAGYWLAGFSDLLSANPGIRSVAGLFGGALVAYLLLSVGALNSGLLFALARPAAPAVATVCGTALSTTVGILLARLWEPRAGALVGLLAGTALFAAVTTVAARRVFQRFDASYYRAF